jgi:succinate dehydrogenase/fumarate reductase flavoprotein subunit
LKDERPVLSETYDVIVVGSGAAGLSAALAASSNGATVLVLEKSSKLGGASALSGGLFWAPNNHHIRECGLEDSREEALGYAKQAAADTFEPELVETYIDMTPRVVEFIERETSQRFSVFEGYSDYYPRWYGGKMNGRTLIPNLYELAKLPEDLRSKIRISPRMFPLAPGEVAIKAGAAGLKKLDFDTIASRVAEGIVGFGASLVASLVEGGLKHEARYRTGVRVRRLSEREGEVTGVVAESDSNELEITARHAVILASGGFEWNQEMKNHFLRGPDLANASPPDMQGDGHLMGMAVGAALGNMNEAWWTVSTRIPGEEYEGHPLVRPLDWERLLPRSIFVNREGKRFTNESAHWHGVIKGFHEFDILNGRYRNIPAYMIFDEGFHEKYALLTYMPDQDLPSWIQRGNSLEELASKISVDPRGLAETVRRFNANAEMGVDPDFHRGENPHDNFMSDPSSKNPNLGPIDKPPYYAVEVIPGSVGTAGGLRINTKAQVRYVLGGVIRRLYAAGNASSNVLGMGMTSGGGSIGPCLVFGHIAGVNAAREAPSEPVLIKQT